MLCKGYDRVLTLAHGDLIELVDARGSTVRVNKGTIWLTQEHDTQDIVLRAGDVWTIERQGLTLVEAQDDALVCVLGMAAPAASAHAVVPGLRDRLARWLHPAWTTSGRRQTIPYY